MSVYIVEMAVLLLAAFVVGGLIGYLARRWLPAGTTVAEEAPVEAETPAEMAPVETTPSAVAPAAVAAPVEPAEPVEKGKPSLLQAPHEGGADNLKKINGIGPNIESTLNGLGVYHLAQIAEWNADSIAWVDERLKFHGRITREDWVGQAKALVGEMNRSGG